MTQTDNGKKSAMTPDHLFESNSGAISVKSGWVSVLTAATLWGTTGLVFQTLGAVGGANAISISFLRLAMSVPFLLVMARLRVGAWLIRPTRGSLLILAGLGISMALYQLTYVLAIERVGVAISVLISICGAPVFVALISVACLHERLHSRTFVALAAAIVGTILLVGLPSQLNPDNYRFWAGIGIAAACALFYALYVLAARAAGDLCSPMHAGSIGFAIGALVLLPFGILDNLRLTYSFSGWAMLFYVAAIPTALAQTLFLGGIKGTGILGGAIASLLEPLVATLLAVIVLQERMGWLSMLGALILLSGIVIMQWTPKRKRA